MHKLSAVLFAALIAGGCRGKDKSGNVDVDLASLEDTSIRSNSANMDDIPPEVSDPELARMQAIEEARNAGVLGSMALAEGQAFARVQAPRPALVATNPWIEAVSDRVSTFAADVDTASYSFMRRQLEAGALPDPSSVRVEELVNYFKYSFPAPVGDTPFAVTIEAAPSPLEPARHIVRVGVATKAKRAQERQPMNLVFLVDVSGSMTDSDKLPLAKAALGILLESLNGNDTVSLVTYAGSTEVVLEPTAVNTLGRAKIAAAIRTLNSGGSTAMGSGLDLAYSRAIKGVTPGHTSRVIVLSDGDANVGAHTHEEMLAIISSRAKEGVTLSTVGFGSDNYNDTLMEQLADRGNGNNFYIDSLAQAKRVFLEDMTANVEVVAKDVKLQIDFDPAMVARYRLLGYENRDIRDQDFRNDKVDAGEVGAGHQVTALYEVELTAIGKLAHAPIAAVRTRHKTPTGATATEAAFPMVGGPAVSFANASADFRFAFAVAAFADLLRNNPDAEHWSLKAIRELAAAAAGSHDDRKEFLGLVDRAITIKGRTALANGQ